MSKSSASKSRNRNKSQGSKAYVNPNKKKGGNGALIWLSLAVVAVAVVIILGINNQSKTSSEAYDFDYADLPRLGSADAPAKIVEFGDYKCPSCKTFAESYKPQLQKDLIDTGKASLYFVNYAFIGKDSITAAEAAEAVRTQKPDAFWTYYDALYANQEDENIEWATPEKLVQIAKDAKLDIDYDKMLSEIQSGVYADRVKEHNALAAKTGVQGTPSLFLNGKQVSFKDYNDLKSQIEAASK
ncbi:MULTISPECIES: DsbA family protein [unclassified Paenibacillus]|uniref:DsbA family protein n=1 Tax=unclassified Paenibacillus TaxID=185978 RepID=UPI0009556F24|nr:MULTISPECIES: DsbA family protein [unclassified Paenibacillus]ASS64987.1 DsbA family protein [Paenibacillus sp. RUD330]SIQ52299.1 Protein-disulfide isomerase [Paenibacillus sp. RU4X]SIQ74768.1 Protein-disulfide isomerase [Paenibacillus sp. RU4T]